MALGRTSFALRNNTVLWLPLIIIMVSICMYYYVVLWILSRHAARFPRTTVAMVSRGGREENRSIGRTAGRKSTKVFNYD